MASYSGIESWLSVVASGITGLGLLKDYGIRSPELEYFIEYCGKQTISVKALAPSPSTNEYGSLIDAAFIQLLSRLEDLKGENVPEDLLNNAIEDARKLYGLLNAMYQTVKSGIVTI
jgi:hypothetical protein